MMRMISLFGAVLTALLFTGCTAAPEPQLETARQMIQTNRAECVLITADGRLLYTPELADTITAPEGCAYDFHPIIAQPAA